MNSKILKTINLPKDRKISEKIDAKPIAFLFMSLLIGIFLCFKIYYLYFGVFLILSAVFALLFLPHHLLIEFSDKYMIVYDRINHDDCHLIFYDEVISWRYVSALKQDFIFFELENGDTVQIASFNKYKMKNLLEKYMPNHEKKNK